MPTQDAFTRRSFLALLAATPFAAAAPSGEHIPIGLELYSVRGMLERELTGTLGGVSKMGYECVEFYAPYYDWTPDYAKQVRQQLDALGLRCYSTHNNLVSFGAGLSNAISLNRALGSRYIVLAHPGEVHGLDGWKRVADTLNDANGKMAGEGMHAGYHNHDAEWRTITGQKPIEVIAANTNKNIMLQLDVGTCLEAGSDPVAWINRNPGRIHSLHLKDWSPQKGYRVLFGEGVAPWKRIFAAAEATGGAEYYLIEQEGSNYSEMETAQRCLKAYHEIHA